MARGIEINCAECGDGIIILLPSQTVGQVDRLLRSFMAAGPVSVCCRSHTSTRLLGFGPVGPATDPRQAELPFDNSESK